MIYDPINFYDNATNGTANYEQIILVDSTDSSSARFLSRRVIDRGRVLLAVGTAFIDHDLAGLREAIRELKEWAPTEPPPEHRRWLRRPAGHGAAHRDGRRARRTRFLASLRT